LEHTSSPICWIERSDGKIQPLGGRDRFADWALKEFPDTPDNAEIRRVANKAPGLGDANTNYYPGSCQQGQQTAAEADSKMEGGDGVEKYKLSYFPAKGRGERVRLTLATLGLTFEDEKVPFPEYQKRKAAGELPFGFLPVLTIDGKKSLGNSISIVWYLASKYGVLIPESPELMAKCLSVANSTEDRFAQMVTIFFASEKEPLITKEKPAAASFIKSVSALVPADANFLFGDSISVGDIIFFDWVQQSSGFTDAEALVKADARLKRSFDFFKAHPAIKTWQSSQQ